MMCKQRGGMGYEPAERRIDQRQGSDERQSVAER
jgi:hypothetical protein